MKRENVIKNFFPEYKLHECAGNDELRPAMSYIHFEYGYAYVTNAHIAVRAKLSDISNFEPDELELLEGKNILATSFKKLLHYKVAQITADGIVAEDGEASATFKFSQDTFKFPNVESIFEGASSRMKETAGVPKIAFKIDFLAKLAKAMGVSAVELKFSNTSNAILVEDYDDSCSIVSGIIMPLLVD